MQKKVTFTKTQFLESKTWGYHKDLINAVLDDGRQYTKEEAKQEIERYLQTEQKGGM